MNTLELVIPDAIMQAVKLMDPNSRIIVTKNTKYLSPGTSVECYKDKENNVDFIITNAKFEVYPGGLKCVLTDSSSNVSSASRHGGAAKIYNDHAHATNAEKSTDNQPLTKLVKRNPADHVPQIHDNHDTTKSKIAGVRGIEKIVTVNRTPSGKLIKLIECKNSLLSDAQLTKTDQEPLQHRTCGNNQKSTQETLPKKDSPSIASNTHQHKVQIKTDNLDHEIDSASKSLGICIITSNPSEPKRRKNSEALRDDTTARNISSALRDDITARNISSCTGEKYDCEKCDKKFSREKLLKEHVKRVHGEVRFKCSLCPSSFKAKPYLREHEELVHGIGKSGEMFECEKCNKKFKSKQTLNRHVKFHDKKQQIHVCPDCGKSFHLKYNLTRHIDLVHKYKDHSMSVCDICGKFLSSATNLRQHVKQIHLKESTFNCHLCEKGFMRQKNLDVHLKRHERERTITRPKTFIEKHIVARSLIDLQNTPAPVGLNNLTTPDLNNPTAPETVETYELSDLERSGLCSVCNEHSGQQTLMQHMLEKHHDILATMENLLGNNLLPIVK